MVTIAATEEGARQKAVAMVTAIIREVKPGEVFENVPVKRILPFGAFIEILPGKEGMVHVSKMAQGFVQHPEDVVTIGQNVTVKVVEVDDQGRINLTMLLDDSGGGEREEHQPRPGGDDRGGSRGGYGDRPRGRSFSPRGREQRTFGRDDRRDDTRSTHPLSRQFQRERAQTQGGPPRRRSPGRKTHY